MQFVGASFLSLLNAPGGRDRSDMNEDTAVLPSKNNYRRL